MRISFRNSENRNKDLTISDVSIELPQGNKQLFLKILKKFKRKIAFQPCVHFPPVASQCKMGLLPTYEKGGASTVYS